MTPLEMILIAVIVILVLLPPKWDPAIRIKERQERRMRRWRETHRPECFGSNPSPQSMAENDCRHCAHAYDCLNGERP